MEDQIGHQEEGRKAVTGHRTYRKFDEEFKREAVRLSRLDGRTVVGTARSLGIDANTLGLWRKQYGPSGSSVTHSTRSVTSTSMDREAAHQHELMELRQQLRRVEEERDILKKAMIVFSRPPR